MKEIITTGLLVALTALGTMYLLPTKNVQYGAQEPYEFVNQKLFHNTVEFDNTAQFDGTVDFNAETRGPFILEGASLEVATAATTSLSAANVCDSSVVRWTASAAAGAITLPSRAAMYADCLTTVGNTKSIVYYNPNATAASTTVITAGASTTLQGYFAASSTQDVIYGGSFALLQFVYYTSTDMLVTIYQMGNAD